MMVALYVSRVSFGTYGHPITQKSNTRRSGCVASNFLLSESLV
jgi:hypothetical protein